MSVFRPSLLRLGSHGVMGEVIAATLAEARAAGTFKSERVITSPQGAAMKVEGGKGGKGKEVLNFCANNYLGLSNHPELVKTAKKYLDSHGFGLSSVRFICGTQNVHKELEKKLAEFHGMEDCILFPSGFDANAGLFESLLSEEDAILSDELNHASIIDGVRLCKAKRFRYKHLSMEDLELKLEEAKDARMRLIATDGVFSMDGDIAPLKKIRELADKYPNTYIMVDECHGTGVFGNSGRGTPDKFQVKVDMITSTLGKALGGATGGYELEEEEMEREERELGEDREEEFEQVEVFRYCTASADIVGLLRQRARPYLFSNSVAPSVVGASLKALEMLEASPELQGKLLENTHYFRDQLNKAGFSVLGHPDCPIVPVMLGDARQAKEMADELLGRGIYVIAFSYPVVPKNSARIRVQMSAAHTRQQLSKAIAGFISVGKEMGAVDRITGEAYEMFTEEGKARASEEHEYWKD